MGQEICQILRFRFFSNFVPKIVRQNQNLMHQNHDFDIEFMILVPKIIFPTAQILFPIPPESQFGTIKFDISDLKNREILICAPKFKFFLDQDLDFLLGVRL